LIMTAMVKQRKGTMQTTLHQWIDRSLSLPPEFRAALSNHMPMALHALSELGGTDLDMRRFYEHYVLRFNSLLPDTDAAPVQNWPRLIGQFDAFATLRATFDEMLAHQSRDAVLRQVLPRLLTGIATAALHGPIRTVHAIEMGHDRELAAALAYWACRLQVLSKPPHAVAAFRLTEWRQKLEQAAQTLQFAEPSIMLRMASAIETSSYNALAGALAPAESLESRLAELETFAVEQYVRSRNFTILHMVTGLRAIRGLLPYLPDTLESQALLTHTATAAYLASGIRPLAQAANRLEWQDILNRARASNDDHVIKLVHACRYYYGLNQDARYLDAASLTVQVD
jgi:hypothetical protein